MLARVVRRAAWLGVAAKRAALAALRAARPTGVTARAEARRRKPVPTKAGLLSYRKAEPRACCQAEPRACCQAEPRARNRAAWRVASLELLLVAARDRAAAQCSIPLRRVR